MKKIFNKVAVFVTVLSVLTACEPDPVIFDSYNGQTLAQFTESELVLPTPESGASVQVNVLVSTQSSVERVIEVDVDEENSTASPEQYSLSNLVIPANSFVGSITITGNYNALPESGNEILTLSLEGIEGDPTSVVENGTLEVELFRKCDIIVEELVGSWEGPASWSEYFGYTSEVETFINEEGKLMLTGLSYQWIEGWWGETIVETAPVEVNINVETGEITIPEQYYLTTEYDGDLYNYRITATGQVLNACEKVIQIFPVLIIEGSPFNPGDYNGVPFKETLKLIPGTGSSEENTSTEI